MVVLDTSIIIKWYQPGEKANEDALKLKEKHALGDETIHVPTLLFWELTNALAFKKEITQKDIKEILGNLFMLGLVVDEFYQEEFAQAFFLARKFGISVYDATYIALAQKLGCQFITADRKLQRKVKPLKFVKLLS